MKFLPSMVFAISLIKGSNALFAGDEFHDLKPLMVVPKETVLKNDFSKEEALDPKLIKPVQETQWKIVDGVLRGTESSKEYQASKPDHNGKEPRLELPITPMQSMATFSVRFIGGTENKNTPVIQFGHHITHLRLLSTGTDLLAQHESVLVYKAPDFKLVDGQWYHVMAEIKGDEVVVQFANGPTFYGKHPSYGETPKSGKRYLGFSGAPGGVIEIDNLTVWSISEEEKKEWQESKAKIPAFEHVDLKAGKGKKEPAKSK